MKASIYGTLFITLAIQALVSAAALTVPVLAPTLAPVFGVPGEALGLYVSALYVGAMIASLSAGGWVARLGAIRLSQVALLVSASGLMCSLLATPAMAIVGAFLVGLGYGPITPASSHLLARTTPDNRMGVVFSIKQTGVPLGGVIAGLAAPKLNEWGGWQAALGAIALACVACAIGAQWVRAALDDDRGKSAASGLASLKQSVRLIFAHPAIRMLAISSLTFSVVQMSLNTYLVTYLHDSLGYSLVVAGFMMSAVQVTGIAGRILWGWCSDRFLGSLVTLALLAVIMTACSWVLASLGTGVSQAVLLVVLGAFGATAVGWNGVYLAEVARQAPPGQIGIATGGTLAATFLGVVFGPAAFGAVASFTGSYRIAFFVLVIPVLIVGILLLANRHRFDREAAPEPR